MTFLVCRTMNLAAVAGESYGYRRGTVCQSAPEAHKPIIRRCLLLIFLSSMVAIYQPHIKDWKTGIWMWFDEVDGVCVVWQQVRKVICEWLAWILRMSRPGKSLSRRYLQRKARMRELTAKSPPSMSLISNVKDVDNAIPLNNYRYVLAADWLYTHLSGWVL